jgi:hypothetical protein
MLIAKVPAVIAAVLFMSSVSAQAMEFADRPGMTLDVVSSLPAFHFILNDDYSRRQINNLNILHPTVGQIRLAERPKPISNIIPPKLTRTDRPGRLSVEFSTVTKKFGMKIGHGRPWMVIRSIKTSLVERPKLISSAIPIKVSQSDRPGRLSAEFSEGTGIKFGYRPWLASSLVKPAATPAAISIEDPILSRFRILAALKIKSENRRDFTSSSAKIKTAYGTHIRPSSVEFCVGSIAPCGRFEPPAITWLD